MKSLRKVLALEADKTALLRQMEEQNIWYMPLKGAVLKEDYPRLGVREMSDYPFFYRHRILLPALYVYRLWKGIFRSRKKLAAEIRTLLHRDSF